MHLARDTKLGGHCEEEAIGRRGRLLLSSLRGGESGGLPLLGLTG